MPTTTPAAPPTITVNPTRADTVEIDESGHVIAVNGVPVNGVPVNTLAVPRDAASLPASSQESDDI